MVMLYAVPGLMEVGGGVWKEKGASGSWTGCSMSSGLLPSLRILMGISLVEPTATLPKSSAPLKSGLSSASVSTSCGAEENSSIWPKMSALARALPSFQTTKNFLKLTSPKATAGASWLPVATVTMALPPERFP